MKQFCFVLASLLVSISSFGQNLTNDRLDFSMGSEAYQQPSMTTAEDILDRYGSFKGAVLNMTRDEHIVLRAWEGFDKDAARKILKDRKDQWKLDHADEIEARKQARMQQTDGCDCWVEPDGSYITVDGAASDNAYSGAAEYVDFSTPAIQLPFEFELYGIVYDSFFLNSKGSVSFGGYTIDWTPEEFPVTTDEVAQIAGFWADSDYTTSGEIYYKVTQEEVYINFVDVGYYNDNTDLLNSYQIVITSDDSGALPDGANTQMCYLDMNWAHGDVGGSGGCCGTSPATVGMDAAPDFGPYLQFGRFNTLDDTYNGPQGTGDGNDDGD